MMMMAAEKLVLGTTTEKRRINWGDLLDEAWGSSDDQHPPDPDTTTDVLLDSPPDDGGHHPDKENFNLIRTSTPKRRNTLGVMREAKMLKGVVIPREKLLFGLSKTTGIRNTSAAVVKDKLRFQALGPKLAVASEQRKSKSLSPLTPQTIGANSTARRRGGGGGRRRCNTVASITGSKHVRSRPMPHHHHQTNLTQLCLDLGQKNFGHVTCQACGMVYSRGETQDEADHSKFHRRYMAGVSFNGWKNERVVGEFFDGRILVVFPRDGKHHLRKVQELCSLVDSELGYAVGVNPWRPTTKMYLYVSTTKKIMGCIFAERITEGYPVVGSSAHECDKIPDDHHSTTTLSTKTQQKRDGESGQLDTQSAWYCSTTPQPAVVGVNRVWVCRQFRRRGVATKILDTIRFNFIPGSVIAKEEIAFSDPTPSGKAFATSYCETLNFLVYHWTTTST